MPVYIIFCSIYTATSQILFIGTRKFRTNKNYLIIDTFLHKSCNFQDNINNSRFELPYVLWISDTVSNADKLSGNKTN